MIKTGARLEELTLIDHNGNDAHLNSNRRKVLFCYPRASTPG
jgi:peroxiredoxin